jgi:hypothetical protein
MLVFFSKSWQHKNVILARRLSNLSNINSIIYLLYGNGNQECFAASYQNKNKIFNFTQRRKQLFVRSLPETVFENTVAISIPEVKAIRL